MAPDINTLPMSITLETRQVNYILQVLGTRPYAEVADIIASIRQQGDAALAIARGMPVDNGGI